MSRGGLSSLFKYMSNFPSRKLHFRSWDVSKIFCRLSVAWVKSYGPFSHRHTDTRTHGGLNFLPYMWGGSSALKWTLQNFCHFTSLRTKHQYSGASITKNMFVGAHGCILSSVRQRNYDVVIFIILAFAYGSC